MNRANKTKILRFYTSETPLSSVEEKITEFLIGKEIVSMSTTFNDSKQVLVVTIIYKYRESMLSYDK